MLQSLVKLPRLYTVGLLFPILFLNGWLLLRLLEVLQPLVSILIAATLIAFVLDYPIRFLQKLQAQRGVAVSLVFLLFVILLVLLVLVLGPLILQQANELLTKLPEWIESGRQQLGQLEGWVREQQFPIDLSSSLSQLVDRLTLTLRSLTKQLVNLIFSTIGSIANVFLTIIFAVFLVLRGEDLWTGVLSWLPASWNAQIREYLPENFERYIAGQVTLASIAGAVLTTVLFILGVPLALLFGFVIGTASLIPFGGTLATLVVSLLVALQDFWLGMKVLAAALIVLQINDNVIGPRIVGGLIGLNPVWMLISLFIGFKLLGGLGLVVAVPIASFIKGTFDRIRAAQSEPLMTWIAGAPVPVEESDKDA